MDVTSISFGKRVNKCSKNQFGWEPVESIPYDEVYVLMSGGDTTKSDKAANGYAKSVLNLLEDNNIDNAYVYSITYDFGANDEHAAIKAATKNFLFKKHFRTKTENGGEDQSDNET